MHVRRRKKFLATLLEPTFASARLTLRAIIYCFGVANERGSLPRMLPYLRDLALSASDKQRPPAVQFAGRILQNALHGYIELIRTRFLKSPFRSEEEALSAYLQDNNRVALPKAEAREFGVTY